MKKEYGKCEKKENNKGNRRRSGIGEEANPELDQPTEPERKRTSLGNRKGKERQAAKPAIDADRRI